MGFSAEETGFRSSTPLSAKNNTPSQTLMGLNLTQYIIVANMHLLYSIEANGVLT